MLILTILPILFVISLQVEFKIFCDDHCSFFYIDEVKQNIDLTAYHFQVSTVDLNIGIGNLLKIISHNQYSHIGISFSVEIDGKTFSSNDINYFSWNSSKVFPQGLYNHAGTELGNFLGQYGDPFEAREFYIQLSNNPAYKNSNKRVFVNYYVTFFRVDSIIIIDSAITNDDIVNNWKFVLVEKPQYGEIYNEDQTEMIENETKVHNLHYLAKVGAKRELIKFRLENESQKSPLTIINIIICDEGCKGCDENDYLFSVQEKMCLGCKSDNYSYKNRCYQQCPGYLYAIDDEWKCVKECEPPYVYYKDNK